MARASKSVAAYVMIQKQSVSMCFYSYFFLLSVTDCGNSRPVTCMQFSFHESLQSYNIKSCTLWLYLVYNHPVSHLTDQPPTHVLELAERTRHGHKKTLGTFTKEARDGWIQLDVQKAVLQRWLRKRSGSKHRNVELICRSCVTSLTKITVANSDNLNPFLVNTLASSRLDSLHSRNKRSPRQSRGRHQRSGCCRLQSSFVNLTEINTKLILAPTVYNAGRCTGRCSPRKWHSIYVSQYCGI